MTSPQDLTTVSKSMTPSRLSKVTPKEGRQSLKLRRNLLLSRSQKSFTLKSHSTIAKSITLNSISVAMEMLSLNLNPNNNRSSNLRTTLSLTWMTYLVGVSRILSNLNRRML
jgi:hypothetical protein